MWRINVWQKAKKGEKRKNDLQKRDDKYKKYLLKNLELRYSFWNHSDIIKSLLFSCQDDDAPEKKPKRESKKGNIKDFFKGKAGNGDQKVEGDNVKVENDEENENDSELYDSINIWFFLYNSMKSLDIFGYFIFMLFKIDPAWNIIDVSKICFHLSVLWTSFYKVNIGNLMGQRCWEFWMGAVMSMYEVSDIWMVLHDLCTWVFGEWNIF